MASTSSALCTMTIGFLNMRWLGPELLGIWQSLTIILAYLPIIQLGIQSGLNLELPLLLGADKKTKAVDLVSTALAYAIFLAVAFVIITVVIIMTLIFKDTDKKMLFGVFIVCCLAILSCFKLHYIATYRSANSFDKLANIYWIDCIVSLILIYAIYKYLYWGLLLFHLAKEVMTTTLMFYFAPYKSIKPKFHKGYFFILLKRGVFMTIFNEIKGIYESLPRLIMLSVGGVIKVGLFNPALTIGTFMNLIPLQIGQFLHPQLGMKYGKTKQARDMWPYFRALAIYMPLFLIIPAILGWLLIPYIIEYAFPRYIDSIWPIKIMLVGFMFTTTYFTRGFLITIKAYKTVIGLQSLEIIMFAILAYGFIYLSKMDMLIALSIALSITYFISYIVNIIVARYTIFLSKYNQPQ